MIAMPGVTDFNGSWSILSHQPWGSIVPTFARTGTDAAAARVREQFSRMARRHRYGPCGYEHRVPRYTHTIGIFSPDRCSLGRADDARALAAALANRTVVFVGDSLMEQQYEMVQVALREQVVDVEKPAEPQRRGMHQISLRGGGTMMIEMSNTWKKRHKMEVPRDAALYLQGAREGALRTSRGDRLSRRDVVIFNGLGVSHFVGPYLRAACELQRAWVQGHDVPMALWRLTSTQHFPGEGESGLYAGAPRTRNASTAPPGLSLARCMPSVEPYGVQYAKVQAMEIKRAVDCGVTVIPSVFAEHDQGLEHRIVGKYKIDLVTSDCTHYCWEVVPRHHARLLLAALAALG